jgi:TolB-like protein/DNA-binding winged helix-turn-helix (wHTH) protein
MKTGASDNYQALYFEDFELDLDLCLLLRGGVDLQLRLQSFDVLRFLVERSGHLVTKEELLSEVWAGRAVTDDSVTQCLMEIRAALDDKHHTKIKTLPRRGYLFDLPVSDTEPGFNQAIVHSSFASGKKKGIALVVVGIALVLILGFLAWRPGLSPPISDLSIAVLPFDNRSNREEDQFFTDGMHDDLLATIAKIGSMKVISRTSVMAYRDTVKKIPQIAKELGVATILEGGIQRSGNQVRINVQLIDAATDEHLWAEIYDRELTAENLFAVQSEITKMIAEALQAKLSATEQQRIDARPTDNLQAYNAYMRGRQLMATRDSAKLKLATEEFNKATRIDPLFALAWVGVADSNMLLSGYSAYSAEDMLPIVEEALKNALAIDNNLGEAYASLANMHAFHKRKGEAETAYQKAIKLSPNYANAYLWYSGFLSAYPLRMREQVELARKAVELDPRSAVFSMNLGSIYRNMGLYTLAERQFQKVIEINPDFARGYSSLAVLYMLLMGQFDKALPLANKAVELDPGNHSYKMILVYLHIQLEDL